MLLKEDPYIEVPFERLLAYTPDMQKRLENEAELKAILDHNQMIKEAMERGEKLGRQKAMKEDIKRGMARVNKLNVRLFQEKRYEDLERSINDEEFQEQLMAQYGL